MSVRVRFAPSPTGFLHIGGLRTALYNYLFARHHRGIFVLRIEDTDQSRYVSHAEQDIIESLEWAGIQIDEGPHKQGSFGPYRQSERREHYHKFAQQLIEQGHAYYAFDTTGEIEEMRERLKKSGNPSPKYDSITRQSMKNSLTLSQDQVQEKLQKGDEYVIRLKVPRRKIIKFKDEIRGIISFDTAGLDDQVLLKSDGMPTYHLANVVDDHMMEITHVIRGEEWLSSAPKHMLLYKALGWEAPTMAHLPLIMSPSGGKLSKRKAETECIPLNTKEYRFGYYEPEALINFLAFLGWNPGDDSEVHNMSSLCEKFTLDRVSKGGAVFNYKKLMWYNEYYVHHRTIEDLLPQIQHMFTASGLKANDATYLKMVLALLHERVSKVDQFVPMGRFFYEAPTDYNENALKKWSDQSAALVKSFIGRLVEIAEQEFTAVVIKLALEATVDAESVGFGKVMMPVRIALSGQSFGPDLFPAMELIGKTECLLRMQTAVGRLG